MGLILNNLTISFFVVDESVSWIDDWRLNFLSLQVGGLLEILEEIEEELLTAEIVQLLLLASVRSLERISWGSSFVLFDLVLNLNFRLSLEFELEALRIANRIRSFSSVDITLVAINLKVVWRRLNLRSDFSLLLLNVFLSVLVTILTIFALHVLRHIIVGDVLDLQ